MTAVLLVTANVGSIFEEPKFLLQSWVTTFLCAVQRLQPKFLALHCQEVGGKNYEVSMQHVDLFVRSLIDSHELADFVHFRIFLDEDFTSTARFTALGNLYFIHKSIASCQIWDFKEKAFTDVTGQAIYSGNIELVPLKEKDKFPKDYFPDCKWSRKGFLRTRWKLSGVPFDLINIHLFHDASNFTAMQEYPSFYTKVRREALTHTLDRIENDEFENVPFFLFGDFNFRLNTGQIVKKLTKDISPTHVKHQTRNSTERLLYQNSCDEHPFLTVEKKVFDLINQEDVFYFSANRHWLLEDDSELDCFRDRLMEKEIKFPPSYPFTEDMCGTTYMKTRCPSWCDRILFSPSADTLIIDDESSPAEYQMLGENTPMGDHKPIFLSFYLNSGNACLPSDGADVIEEHDSQVLRSRTNSSSPVFRHEPTSNARRVLSLLPSETKTDTRSPQWVQATQAVLRSLRLRQGLTGSMTDEPEPKQRTTRLSSRLTSHHSSSSEEWYSELQLLSELPDVQDGRQSPHSASQPDIRSVGLEMAADSSKELDISHELRGGEESAPENSADLATEQENHKRRKRCCSRCNLT